MYTVTATILKISDLSTGIYHWSHQSRETIYLVQQLLFSRIAKFSYFFTLKYKCFKLILQQKIEN